MMQVSKSSDRFHTQVGWLDSQHTFSFGEHYDPKRLGFRNLRVINEDKVRAGQGFGTHGHKDMEIVSYVVAGALGQAGDLGESLLKRSVGVKDSGGIVPGHGGILDRVDALLVTGTLTYLYVVWVRG